MGGHSSAETGKIVLTTKDTKSTKSGKTYFRNLRVLRVLRGEKFLIA